MPVNISSVGPSSVRPEQPANTSSQPSGPASPSPQDLQATINHGIQQAAQNLNQIIGAVTGNAPGVSPQTSSASNKSESDLQSKDNQTLNGIAQNFKG